MERANERASERARVKAFEASDKINLQYWWILMDTLYVTAVVLFSVLL